MGHKGDHMRSHGKYHMTDKYLKRSKKRNNGGPSVTRGNGGLVFFIGLVIVDFQVHVVIVLSHGQQLAG